MDYSFMFYREVSPSPEFSHLVLSFWKFIVSKDAPAPIHHEIFPDGCVSLIHYRNDTLNIRQLTLNRLHLETIKMPLFAGDTFWGMRISPAAAATVFGVNPTIFQAKNNQSLLMVPHLTEGLSEKLKDCHNFTQAIEIYENRLKQLNFVDKNCFDQKIAEALQIIEESTGQIKISEISMALNISQRQLERRFKSSSGLTPKQFVRARRIRATAINIIEENNQNWATRAAQIGFTDQSHLNHEVISVTGRSPSSFAERVRQIDHENILK